MGTRFTLLALGLICLLVCGCASKKKDVQPQADPTVVKFEKFRQTYDAAINPDLDDQMAFDADMPAESHAGTRTVIQRAHKAIGTPYVFGGTRPSGFDCSGFVQWAYKGAGIKLPRTAAEQSRTGYRIRSKSQLRAGDIVAFRRRGGYHTGIYIGDGKFIHAPRRNKRVRIESMSTDYFARNYIGARRVDMSDRNEEVIAAVRKLDKQYENRKYTASKSKKYTKSKKYAKSKNRKYTASKSNKYTKSKKYTKARKTGKKYVASNTRSSKKSVSKSRTRVSSDKAKPRVSKAKARSKSKSKVTASRSVKKTSAVQKKKTAQAKTRKHIQVRKAKKSVDQARAARSKEKSRAS